MIIDPAKYEEVKKYVESEKTCGTNSEDTFYIDCIFFYGIEENNSTTVAPNQE